jgi:hypothetical protein
MAAQQRALVTIQQLDVKALKQVFAAAGRIQATEDIHCRRFSRTTRPHDGNEIASGDAQIDASQCLKRGLTLTINFSNAGQLNQRRSVNFTHGLAS